MYNDPTLSNTAPASPYADFSPYAYVPSIPPPPPKQKHSKRKIALIVISMLLISIGVVSLFFYSLGKYEVSNRSGSTPTMTYTPLSPPYTAMDIINDFTSNNLSVSNVTSQSLNKFLDGWGTGVYGSSESIVTTQPISSVFFRDPTACVGPCDTQGDMFLAIYGNETDAQASLDQVRNWANFVNSCGCGPYLIPNDDIQHGRCLLITYEPPTSGYALIEEKSCI